MSWRYFGAFFLIAVGILFFLNNLGILPGVVWNYFWPLLLILLGIAFLLGALGRVSHAPVTEDSLPIAGAESAQLEFRHGAGRLYVGAVQDASLLYRGKFGGGVEKQVRQNGTEMIVSFQTGRQAWEWMGPFNWWGPTEGLNWDVRLNPRIPLALEFETGASRSELDLSQLCVRSLRLQTGASSTEITMPANAGATRAKIESGVASVRVRIPAGVGARIYGQMGLGSLDVDSGRFPRKAGGYESEDYTTAANRIELEVEGGVGSVYIR